MAVIDVSVGYRTETEDAIQIIQTTMEDLRDAQPNIVGDVAILGVQSLNDSNYTIRATAECAPYTHFGITRLAKQRIREAFSKQNVDLPSLKVVYIHDHMNPNQSL